MSADYVFVALIWALLAFAVLGLIFYYANRNTEWFVIVSTFIGWLFPFSIVLLLPLDLTSTLYNHCVDTNGNNCEPPHLYVSEGFLWVAWRTIYWTMFVLTFLVIPLVQAYCDSGYFSAIERFKKAIRANIIYYAVLGVGGLIALAIVAATGGLQDKTAFLGLIMTIANLFGLSLVILLMSYGLVDMPKSIWQLGDVNRSLRYAEFTAPKVKDALNDADAAYDDLLQQIQTISAKTRFHDDMRIYVDMILDNVPNMSDRRGRESEEPSISEANVPAVTDVAKLAKLNKQFLRAKREKERCDWEWNAICQEAFFLQDILMNKQNPDKVFKSSLTKSNNRALSQAKWIWYVVLFPWVMRLLAVIFAIVSLAIVWSELVYVVPKIVLSVIGAIFNGADVKYGTIEFISVGFLLYMCACCMHSLFKVKIFNMYSLHGNRHTSNVSLCWFTCQMCRLTFPLCYNFMAMAVCNTETTIFFERQPIFSQLMGQMRLDGLQFYVPVLVAIVTFMNVFNVVGRLAKMVGFQDDLFSGDNSGTDVWSDVEDGRLMLADARSKLERASGSRSALNELHHPPPVSSYDDRSRLLETSPERRPVADKPLSNYKANNPLYAKYANKFNQDRV